MTACVFLEFLYIIQNKHLRIAMANDIDIAITVYIFGNNIVME